MDMEIRPDVAFLLANSVGRAALDATAMPGVLQPWVDKIEEYVQLNGKFSQSSVLYLPFSPPPVFWDYKCKKCHWWQVPQTLLPSGTIPGSCKVVEGEISHRGWCAIWAPSKDYKALTWPQELLKGEW